MKGFISSVCVVAFSVIQFTVSFNSFNNLVLTRNSCPYGEVQCLDGFNWARRNSSNFQMSNIFCIKRDFLCNGDYDCTDGSDEMYCSGISGFIHRLTQGSCLEGESMCISSWKDYSRFTNALHCVRNSWICDGYNDCIDGSDELHCPYNPSKGFHFEFSQHGCVTLGRKDYYKCKDTNQCIHQSSICNSHHDCTDRSDEFYCPYVFVNDTRKSIYPMNRNGLSIDDLLRSNSSSPSQKGHLFHQININLDSLNNLDKQVKELKLISLNINQLMNKTEIALKQVNNQQYNKDLTNINKNIEQILKRTNTDDVRKLLEKTDNILNELKSNPDSRNQLSNISRNIEKLIRITENRDKVQVNRDEIKNVKSIIEGLLSERETKELKTLTENQNDLENITRILKKLERLENSEIEDLLEGGINLSGALTYLPVVLQFLLILFMLIVLYLLCCSNSKINHVNNSNMNPQRTQLL